MAWLPRHIIAMVYVWHNNSTHYYLIPGVVATCKAVISEVSDDSNQAFGISIVGSSFGLGYIIGPAISGAISDPIGQYNLNITSKCVIPSTTSVATTLFPPYLLPQYILDPFLRDFLTRFPYSLPCIVNFFLILIGVLVAAIFLPETLGKKKYSGDLLLHVL